jgi:hypothetical protein
MNDDFTVLFQRRTPAILVVDDFYKDPDLIRRLALDQEYQADTRYFKGERSLLKFLLPHMKEEFERLLGVTITDWTEQPANGSFQKTSYMDPIVWHSDTQRYAGAIYLTPKLPHEIGEQVGSGTSFWRHKNWACRRPPAEPEVHAEVYSEYNLLHPNAWELVDRVGSVYNRLVLWDGQLIHSATSYAAFSAAAPRLVQLFFFNAEAR